MSIQEEVAGEVASLYAFIQSISAACSHPPPSAAYTDSSERFFEYIQKLSQRTLEHLSKFPIDLEGTEEEFQDSRRELSIIRRAWRELHRFIKPALDADTLNQPTALVTALLNRLQQLPGFELTDFAIFHTDEFNYFQVSPVLMARAVDGLASIVGGEELAKPSLIGIPNSQGTTLFLNTLMAHEVGHHAFEMKSIRPMLVAEVETALGLVLGEKYSKNTLPNRSTIIDSVVQWSEELFCDLFAVYLVGPSYSFAYLELYDIAALLGKDGRIRPAEIVPFYPQYPSDLFRVRQQALLLKELDWWRHLAPIQSRSSRMLSAVTELSEQHFIDVEKDGRKAIVETFIKIVPEISTHVARVCGRLDSGSHQFAELWGTLAEYLDQGIVPSSINIKTGPSKYEIAHPSAISIINAAYRYYLERMDRLMASVKGQDSKIAERRVYWINKIQSWAIKALEDVALIGKSKHVSYL